MPTDAQEKNHSIWRRATYISLRKIYSYVIVSLRHQRWSLFVLRVDGKYQQKIQLRPRLQKRTKQKATGSEKIWSIDIIHCRAYANMDHEHK